MKTTIEFFRRPDNIRTEYFELPLDQEGIELLMDNYVRGQTSEYAIIYGLGKRRVTDKYDRKIGKEFAQKNVKKVKAKIDHVLVTPDKISIQLTIKKYNTDIVIDLNKTNGKIICF